MKKTALQKIQDLKQKILYHDRLYYNLDRPEITDYEYDQLFKKLTDLEEKYPHLKTKDSPTQKVPGKALDKFQKATHRVPMLSLQNSYSQKDLEDFYKRTQKLLSQEKLCCFVEPKLDGVAVELIYENSVLTKALTRGDGKTGENITENIKSLKGLPLSLPSSAPRLLEVRGEVLILKKDFNKINDKQREAGLKVFANPRNLSAGSIRHLDPKVSAKRPLYFFAHSPGLIQEKLITSQHHFIDMMKNLSIPSFYLAKDQKPKPPLNLCQLTYSIKDILNYYHHMLALRHELPFEMDGIVIKINTFEKQKKLGSISRSPRWAIAGKFPPEEGVTQIKDIKLQVGRTGVITPVAILKKIALGGIIVRQASLHSFQDLNKKDLRVGDFVLIHRAGDVIPEVIKALKEKRPKHSSPFKPPDLCPECQSQLIFRGDYLTCKNPNCPAVKKNQLIHFASRKAMNIEFLGEKSLQKFYHWGWLKSFSDFYELKNKPLKEKEGFGEKSYELLVKSLEKSKETKLSTLIFALGIPLLESKRLKKLVKKFIRYLKNKPLRA